MNDRLPTGECEAHFWADESRELIRRLDIINGLFGALKGTPLAFNIDSYYADLFLKCRDFCVLAVVASYLPIWPK